MKNFTPQPSIPDSSRSTAQGGFSLLELIVVISILAVLLLIVALTLDPIERLGRAWDTERIHALETVDDAIAIAKSEAAGADATWDVDGGEVDSCAGEAAQKIFVSVPDSEAPPMAPMGWTYAQVSEANLQNLDGTGWLPLDLTVGGVVDSPISHLPLDPANSFASGFYFSYICDRATRGYELTANMTSEAYQNGGPDDVESMDSGDDNDWYETGTDLTLHP